MPDRVDPDDLAALAELHRSGDDRDVDVLPSPRPPAAVGRAGEAHHAAVVSPPGNGQAGRGVPCLPRNRCSWCPVGLISLEPRDASQTVRDDALDWFTGERRPTVSALFEKWLF